MLAVAAAACGADVEQADPELAAPPAQTTAPPPTTEAVSTAPAEASAPTATTETPAVTTTTAPTEPAPAVIIWSAPRLNGTTLSASWQVTPGDANCSFDLLNEAGEVIGTGVPQVADASPDGRGMRADYDPASADALGTFVIRCSRLGGPETAVTSDVHRVTYKNRSPDSVLPATDEYYFDHDEVAALFPDCRRARIPRPNPGTRNPYIDMDTGESLPLNKWLDAGLDFFQHEVFAGWDTATHEVDGRQLASGWWTTEQLIMRYPRSTVTAEMVRERVRYDWDLDKVWLAGDGSDQDLSVNPNWHVFPDKVEYSLPDGTDRIGYSLEHLWLRLNDVAGHGSVPGAVLSWPEVSDLVRADRIAADGPNPSLVRPGNLLWDWMDARYRFEPIDREPTAWAMRTLLEARDSDCVAATMREHCESGEFHASPHMRHPSHGGSRLGSVLWSAVCPDVAPAAP